MRTRKTALLLAIGLLVAGALAGLLPRDSEPRYHGRSLSTWLVLYWNNAMTQASPEFEEAEQAIRATGTNALPYLLKWIRQEPPPWRRAARAILPTPIWDSPHATFLTEGPGYERAGAAVLAFGILGTNAASAIPELTAMMDDPTHPRTATHAITALSSLGPPAFPHLTAALSNTNHPYRARIATFLGAFMVAQVGTNACLPPLRAALNDPDPQVRAAASHALRRFTNTPPQ